MHGVRLQQVLTRQDVECWLDAHPGWHSTSDIAEGLRVTSHEAAAVLTRMYVYRHARLGRRRRLHHNEWGTRFALVA